MANTGHTSQANSDDRSKNWEIATLSVRLAFFALAIAPMGALLLPWVTLDGTAETHTGIATVALLASPVSAYLYEVNPIQAATLTVGTAVIALLSMLTAYHYHQRKSAYWAPLAVLAIAASIVFGTGELADATHSGPSIVIVTTVLLLIHRTLIRVHLAMRRKGKLHRVQRVLAIATGAGYYRWRDA